MLVKTYYSAGHFDVFDTATLVDGSVFKGNALTNYALEISDARGGKALWLDCYYYEADKEYQLKVSVDGEDVLVRQGDEFIDATRLKIASDVAYSINPASVSTYDYYQVAAQEQDPCERIGYTQAAYEHVALAQRRAATPDERQGTVEGDTDENRFSIR